MPEGNGEKARTEASKTTKLSRNAHENVESLVHGPDADEVSLLILCTCVFESELRTMFPKPPGRSRNHFIVNFESPDRLC